MNIVIMVLLTFILDLLIGDSHPWSHPVEAIGRLTAVLTKKFNRPEHSRKKRKYLGIAIWLIMAGGTGLVAYTVMRSTMLNYYLYMIVETYLSYICLSARQLAIETEKIMKSLRQGGLKKARYQVGMVVGRNTGNLDAEEVTKATIEAVTEGTSDGVVAPLLLLVIGGPVLKSAYKAINTLGSMVGYRNEKYRDLGEFLAKVDDIADYIPVRLAWLFLIISSWVLRDDTSETVVVGKRDCKKHLSPNSTFNEAIVAGVLHLQLGGPHYYFDELVGKPYIGNNHLVVAANWHLRRTITMLYMVSLLSLGCFELIRLLIIWR